MSDPGPEELLYRLKPIHRLFYREVRAAKRAEEAGTASASPPAEPESRDPVHAQIRQQVADLLADTELSADERNRILDSIACPCCGGSGASFSLSIRPMGQGGF